MTRAGATAKQRGTEARMSHLAAIALGSNLNSPFGDRAANLTEALRRIGALGHVKAISTFHDTEPVGFLDQPRFLNAAALIETTLEPEKLMVALLAVEREMGRTREGVMAKGPRVIDLDLLLYDARILSTADLTLPHPAMHERGFVLAPLAEIAPQMTHPVLKLTVMEMLQRLD
ncbi:MAG TPA: 2-amino-4-hydroxy-6-hydroxymethyldihydropteridine diphosphokinase [Edaphobacter sp.]